MARRTSNWAWRTRATPYSALGSLTKQFTAAAIMLLRERGRLSLADPICTYSTVDDLYAWNEALFNDRLLTAESRTAMTTPGKGAYGYGLRIGRMHNRALVYHGGSINGFDALLMRFTDERVTIVVLRNADYGTPSEDAIGRDLAAILFGEPDEAQGR